MPKVFTSKTQKTGEIGENIATKFLVKHGYIILERNYTKKWGELDIVAEKEGKVYFIEVKSVVSSSPLTRGRLGGGSSEFTSPRPSPYKGEGEYRPEENMHPRKLQRMSRAIQTYLLSRKNVQGKEWQVDLLIVYLDLKSKKARIKILDNIVL